MSMDSKCSSADNNGEGVLYPELSSKEEFGVIESKSGNYFNMLLVMKAADFAARRHRQQRRKDLQQTPYINHPVGM